MASTPFLCSSILGAKGLTINGKVREVSPEDSLENHKKDQATSDEKRLEELTNKLAEYSGFIEEVGAKAALEGKSKAELDGAQKDLQNLKKEIEEYRQKLLENKLPGGVEALDKKLDDLKEVYKNIFGEELGNASNEKLNDNLLPTRSCSHHRNKTIIHGKKPIGQPEQSPEEMEKIISVDTPKGGVTYSVRTVTKEQQTLIED